MVVATGASVFEVTSAPVQAVAPRRVMSVMAAARVAFMLVQSTHPSVPREKREDCPMFDNVLDKLGGGAAKYDPRKVIDLIDDLWGSRQKIVEAVDFVWDNREPISAAIAFMRDHADDLIDLGKRLPGFLANAGEALETAGDGAHKASLMILGDGGDDGGVLDVAADAAEALERCRDELWAVMGMFDRAGSGLADIPVIGDVAAPLVDASGRIGSVSDDLGAVARRIRRLGEQLTDAGHDLGWVGDSLGTSGVALQRFAPDTEVAPDYLFSPDKVVAPRRSPAKIHAAASTRTTAAKKSVKKSAKNASTSSAKPAGPRKPSARSKRSG
jgi:hypothetical protein